MKIDKIVFSVSEPAAYSSYWNIHSKIWKTKFNIEPVCLLFGKKSNTDMNEDYGKVIEMEVMDNLPWVIQMTMSKFYFPITEPETTWLIGDIDLIPLQKQYFTTNILEYADDSYLHLNNGGISRTRCGYDAAFLKNGSEIHCKNPKNPGSNLPGHYHVAKGKLFEKIYFKDKSFVEVLNYIVDSQKYGMGVASGWPSKNKNETLPLFSVSNQFWWYWLSEEGYTSEHLYNAIKGNAVSYFGLNYNNHHDRIWQWNKDVKDYSYNLDKLINKKYIDIHCCQVRPYQLQSTALDNILQKSYQL